jgi:uncharacterized OB-fold protein/acyl dehydratase
MSHPGATGSEPRDAERTALEERLRSFVDLPAASPDVARDPVNAPMIRHWCDAIGDRNPVYTDEEVASRSRHAGIVAPPTMLQAWSFPGLAPPLQKPSPNSLARIVDVLDQAGLTGVVATDCEQEYPRYLKLGDRIRLTTTIEEVSEQKQTALGTGYFVTSLMTFRDESEDVVGRMRFRILKFRPSPGAAAAASAPAPAWPRPALNEDNAFFWDGVNRGELPIQKCSGCGKLRHPPRPMCPYCRSVDWGTVASTGRGVVYSFVVPHYPVVPPFEFPFVVVLVELEEGVRFVSNLIDVEPGDVRIGMPVELCFETVEEGLTLPRFRPAGTGGASAGATGAAPAERREKATEGLQPRETTLRFEEVSVGDAIPPLEIPLTSTLIIATAIASRDYQDVHHDRDAAKGAGSKDIFMNILSTNGFIGRYVTDWAGPETLIRKVAIRLGAPNYPGDTMRITGRVARTDALPDGGTLELEVSAKNAYGDHATGTVLVELPGRG